MTTTTKGKKIKQRKRVIRRKLDVAKNDFLKLMASVEPYTKKSDIVIHSTDGKWFETSSEYEQILIQNISKQF